MLRRMLPDTLAVIFICAAVLMFFLRLIYPTYQLLITPDFGQSDAVTSLTTKFIYTQSLINRAIPFWSDAIGGGFPIYANGGMGVWYIPNIVFFYFLPFVPAYIVSLFFSAVLLGIGMYAWLRTVPLSRISSIFGGVTAALSGYILVQFTHLTIVQSISLFPWIMYLCHRAILKNSRISILLLAIVYSQLVYVGFAQSIFITTLFLITYAIWCSSKQQILVSSMIRVCISIAIGIALSAVHLLPAIEYLGQLNDNGNFSPEASTLFSYPFIHLGTLIDPYLLGNPADGTYPHFFAFGGSIFWENTAYIGVLPLLFIIGAIASRLWVSHRSTKRNSYIQYSIFFTAIILVSLLLMTGRNSPVYFLFSFFPLTLFRVPSRFIWLFVVSLIWIASISLHIVFSRIKQQRLRYLLGAFILLIQVCNILYVFSQYHNTEPANEWLQEPSLTQYMLPGYTYTIGGETAFNAAYMDHGWIRKNADDRPSYVLRNTFTPDKNALWGVKNLRDYSGRELKRTKVMNDLLKQIVITDSGHATISATGEKLLSLYGVSNIISTLDLTHETFISKASLSSSEMQISLFHNPHSLPKAYTVAEAIRVHTVSEAVEALTKETFVLGKTVLIESELGATFSAIGTQVVTEKTRDGEYTFSFPKQQSPILLVVTENYYPGWQASTQGNVLTPFPVNVSQIGLLVPAQTSEVSLRFIPTDFHKGAIISILSILLTAIAMALLWKR